MMDEQGLERWFDEYLEAFQVCGRGEKGVDSVLPYFSIPLVITTDEACNTMTNEGQVATFARQQIDGMLAESYDRTEVVTSRSNVLNGTSGLFMATLLRRRRDGTEINRLAVTYLV